MLHYYRRTASGMIEHSTADGRTEDITVDRRGVTELLGWPTPAMAPEVDDQGEPSGWYVGTTLSGTIVDEDEPDDA